jgi:hypothetical protein
MVVLMDAREIDSIVIPHLAGQFERALPILFTGAGFSLAAKDKDGNPIMSYTDLKRAIWDLCFRDESFDADTTLQDLYDTALRQHPKDLETLLIRAFSVDPDSLPSWVETVFAMPWAFSYTLNVDDLAQAASRKFHLPRRLETISAAAGVPVHQISPEALQVVHLNGTLRDVPGNVTFSLAQYAERLTRTDFWYSRLTANLVSHSIVFIGTRLDEPPLWQHLELRRQKGARGMRELRPRSYLVTPTLDRARQALLAEYNVLWLPMTSEEFASQILAKLKKQAVKGLGVLAAKSGEIIHDDPSLEEVSSLTKDIRDNKSEFLLGQEPSWADLHYGRAILRESDEQIWQLMQGALNAKGLRGVIVFTGTAGSGKSTALMRACLRLNAEGVRVGWIGRESYLTLRDIRTAMRSDDAPAVLAIDDADLLGFELATTTQDICRFRQSPLVLLAIRSSRVDSFISEARLQGVPLDEIAMPHLTDSDIHSLIDVLDKENRLGILKAIPRDEQVLAFKRQAGRQLIVAMIQATSGRRFEEKVMDELSGLDSEARYIHALVAVATFFRFDLSREDILVASGDRSNQALNVLDQLVRRNVVVKVDGRDALVRARHRVIAEIIMDHLQATGQLAEVIVGLIQVAAVKVNVNMPRSSRPWRLLRALMNHDFLKRSVNVAMARNIYGSIEQLLSWNYHYWLQRGSLEVELDEVSTAENFLNQARSLGSDDPLVENEWAYLLFRKAILSPGASSAPLFAKEATELLEDLIDRRGDVDPYPFHVLGSQGLAWSRRGISNKGDLADYLRRLLRTVKSGCEKHPKSNDLRSLLEDMNTELLSLAVN